MSTVSPNNSPNNSPDPSRAPGPDTAPDAGPIGLDRLVVDTPAPGVRVIGVSGTLNADSGARLLRLLDSQFALARTGHRRLDTVIVDLDALHTLDRGGAATLAHARYACGRRGIAVVLAGRPAGMATTVTTDLNARARLRGFSVFPTLDAAVAAVTGRRGSPEAGSTTADGD